MDEKSLHVRRLCLGQAQGFIDAAERLGGGPEWPHFVYHLSLLALEEVGKASIVGAGSIRPAQDDRFVERWVDNHRRKLQWAVWSPMMNTRIDPADFEAAREFAERAHALRLASLYVDPKADLTDVPASDQVKPADAERALGLARARLAVETAHEPSPDSVDELLEWFLETMNEPERSKMILSPPFVDKYAELKGDSRTWLGWARDELNRLDVELREIAETELKRPGVPQSQSKPRWRANTTIYTPSHSVRPKILTRWNERFDLLKLVAFANKKDRFTLQITLHDNEPLPTLAGRLTTLAKLAVEVGMSSQRVSGTAVQRTIAVLGSAAFFVVAPCTLAGLVPWSITGWRLRPPFLEDQFMHNPEFTVSRELGGMTKMKWNDPPAESDPARVQKDFRHPMLSDTATSRLRNRAKKEKKKKAKEATALRKIGTLKKAAALEKAAALKKIAAAEGP